MDLREVSSAKCFGGYQKVFKFQSAELNCETTFSVFIPPENNAGSVQKWPVLYWLSGLTCTEANFIQKSGFQRYAAESGIVVVGPDTSPRGCNIEGEEESWDFGSGAGFYLDATVAKWEKNYRMYSYVTKELPKVVAASFPVDISRQSISGHSMGGHGALICYLKNPGMYKSVSAFAPICNPILSPWGIKAFSGYLGSDQESWKQYDATELIKNADPAKYSSKQIRIDQGDKDEFLKDRLLPDNFLPVAKNSGFDVDYKLREGYDHSYFFISSFIGEHISYHAKHLSS